MNAVLLSLAVLFGLSLLRVHVVLALLVSAIIGGWSGGMPISDTIAAFSEGLKDNAGIALSYALLGAFAAGLAETGLPERLVRRAVRLVRARSDSGPVRASVRYGVLAAIAGIACLSQNAVPVHIAFIPVLIPPLLMLFNAARLDRRAVACALTFGLITPYMLLPVGFGAIFHDIVASNMTQNGLAVDASLLPKAMLLPALGMIAGLLFAMMISYRKPRDYAEGAAPQPQPTAAPDGAPPAARSFAAGAGIAAIAAMLAVQLSTGSMIYGAAAGLAVLLLSRVMPRGRADRVLSDGMRSMAYIGFVMMSAAGLGAVLRETGHIESLVKEAVSMVGDNRALAAILMLAIGLLVTLGIGSSFSTIPLIATVFVPLCVELGFSPLATISLIGTAAALGDAGSPASDSTLGPTAGLNADGQHDHIWDTCVPTFLHYNVPLLLFGFLAAMML
ncbi:sodium:proton antiporter [Paenibacillus thiaminolyticus]|uniref:Sodium:proton antiporter n=2 Tax=Paenibacillus thiaminolyticus TaxID=49283 RepID=A0AAP9E0C6_PANTH|nr:Na+/H+ antiporter NhaC family protein [Paenibacillus thiaminolyticus]MCY9534721.1 sodium:proton antiporter [Paenibacillus thiaminolyticus]MCY9602054.1 sodium:proton antiporter [Paenibacillus thiaminolyticus]MCY9608888.1 sodium:proton antiporter [Paenibacillus thiaminolyticus]MCY9614942.1 sodium:proton antiporter [Paenibacillus thiaminolyticus]MCY9618484.1 sodium:proton antiporter [Paenibacillus thiaminolyticus]